MQGGDGKVFKQGWDFDVPSFQFREEEFPIEYSLAYGKIPDFIPLFVEPVVFHVDGCHLRSESIEGGAEKILLGLKGRKSATASILFGNADPAHQVGWIVDDLQVW